MAMAARKTKGRTRRATRAAKARKVRSKRRSVRARKRTTRQTRLLKLVAGLLARNDLRHRFNQDPMAVITEFGLTTAERGILFSMDTKDIGKAVAKQFEQFEKEVREAEPDETEFPPCSEDYKPELSAGRTEYPSPTPAVYRIRPRKVLKSDIASAGEQVELIITGRSFCRDPLPYAKIRRMQDGVTWNLADVQLFGTFRCSRLRATFNKHEDDNEISIGGYQIIVNNNSVDIERTRPIEEPDFEVKSG
jgi:hypothetical protein